MMILCSGEHSKYRVAMLTGDERERILEAKEILEERLAERKKALVEMRSMNESIAATYGSELAGGIPDAERKLNEEVAQITADIELLKGALNGSHDITQVRMGDLETAIRRTEKRIAYQKAILAGHKKELDKARRIHAILGT